MNALQGSRLAESLRTADSFVAVAGSACTEAGLRGCTIAYHLQSGRPLCTVDAVASRCDEDRLRYLAEGWKIDTALHEMLDRRTAVVVGDEALIPIVDPHGIVASIRCGYVPERELWIASMLVAVRLVQLGIASTPDRSSIVLTSRQREVAKLAAEGLITRDIASQLAISSNTVKKLLKRVFDVLAVDNRVELVHRLKMFQVVLDVAPGVVHVGALAIARGRAALPTWPRSEG